VNVLVVAHGRLVTPGWLRDALEEISADHTILDFSRGDPLPMGGWDKVVLMGGHMGAYEVTDHPWLVIEKEFIRTQLAEETPVLGVCLGAQLLADVVGGRAFPSTGTEVGFITLQRTEAGETDAVVTAIDGPVVTWHHDTFELPPEAELLAFTSDYPHAFRYGSAFGVQFHPELTPEMWSSWMSTFGTDDLVEAGLHPDEFASRLANESGRLRNQAVTFFRTWLEE